MKGGKGVLEPRIQMENWELLDAAYRAALEDAPQSAPEHRIGRLEHVCSPREGWPLRVGYPSPYLQGVTASRLQLRCQFLREQALADLWYWAWMEAHITGGRFLAYGRWTKDGVKYKVAVIAYGGWYTQPIAVRTIAGRTEWIRDRRLLTRLMDDLLYDECDDAVYREMQRRGIAHLADVWPFDEIVRRAMDGVIECAWDPVRAAEWAVDLEIKMQKEGL